MKYRVLLVDDDNIVLTGLRSLIDWEGLGFTIIGEASDGLQAMSMIDDLLPQLVITDIYMRYCDGIRLMQQVKEKHPDILFIVLSCYDNFDYARNALRLGAMNYLLKSNVVQKEELTEALIHVRESLEKSDRTSKRIENLQKRLNLSMPRYRKQFLLDVLGGRLKDSSVISLGLAEMNFDARSQNFFLVVMQFTDAGTWHKQTDEIDILDEKVVAIMSDIMIKYGVSEVFCVKHSLYYGLIDLTPKENLYSLEDRALSIAELIRIKVKNQLDQDGLILLDHAVPVENLSDSDDRLRQALDRSLYLPRSAVMRVEDVFRLEKKQPVISQYPALESTFFNQSEFEQLVNKFFNIALENHYLPYFEGICDDLTKVFHRFASEFVDFEDESDFQYVQSEDFLNLHSIDLAREKALTTFRVLRNELIYQRNASPKHLVRDVIDFIDSNYATDISLDALARQTNFNKYYICKKFKKETGMTITNYILELRITKAKEMLLKLSDNRRIYEVAQEVGFSDVSYFDRIFKKLTQETPRDFVDRNRRRAL